ncbi:hypothetical protein RJT34_10840 [Clitoria ternatea]|uniref:Uncharacterized protein n=1 Tax=Clitoria ternatea TaxID=43366 RepID=A0AAN9JME3_CLITE
MGINFSFCSCGAYFSPQRLSKEDSCDVGKDGFVAWIVENIKQTYFLRWKRLQEKNKEGKKQLKKGKELTLEEWLLKSPIMEKDGNCNGGDHCSFKHHTGSDYPSVAGERTHFSDFKEYGLSLEQLLDCGATLPMDKSISLENLLKDEKVDVKEVEFNSLTRNQSCKAKKRVSFRLPEVSETFTLHPSEVNFEDC